MYQIQVLSKSKSKYDIFFNLTRFQISIIQIASIGKRLSTFHLDEHFYRRLVDSSIFKTRKKTDFVTPHIKFIR